MQIIVAIIAATVLLFLVYIKWCFTYWARRNVFTLPPSLPFGNVKESVQGKIPLAFSVLSLYREAKSKGLRYAGYYFVNKAFLLAVDMDLVRLILVKDFQYFTDQALWYINEEVDPLTGSLIAQKGAKWKALRRKLTPTFSVAKVKYMFQTVVQCTQDLPTVVDEVLSKHEPIDIKEIFARYTTDVIGRCAFGIDCNCLKDPNTEFRKYGKIILENTPFLRVKRLLSVIMPGFFRYFKIPLEDKDVERFIINIVKESIAFRDQTKTERKDFMQLLMKLRHQELKIHATLAKDGSTSEGGYYQNGLSINEIAAQAFIFFGAGFETSSTTLTYLMYELAMQPNIQEKLRKSINEVLVKHNGDITYESINEISYLDKCISETLRKYPPVPLLARNCVEKYMVPDSNLAIERDTKVFISVYGIHHDPEYYPDPEKFDPERFSEENINKRPPMTFLGFGEGPRICLGLRFGLIQVKVGLVAMIKHFKFTLNPKTKLPLEFRPGFILTVKDNIWLDAERLQ